MGTVESASESEGARRGRLNTWVAVTVALLATFMGICKVKDDNIVQGMVQAQADQIDNWAWYQARNIREEVRRSATLQLEALASTATQQQRAAFTRAIAESNRIAAEQETKKAEQRRTAEAAAKLYDELNYRDDQFDLSDAALALSIALLAMTALTQKRWLFAISMVPTVFGVIMGLAGLLGWKVHPGLLARWLGT